MRIHTRLPVCGALLAASLLSACGDDSPADTTTTSDTTQDTARSETTDTLDGQPGETVEPFETVDQDSSAPDSDTTPDAADTDLTPDATADTTPDTTTDTVEPPISEATLTIDGAATAVTPSVRRGFVYTQPVQRTVYTQLNQPAQLVCEGTGNHLQGGRIISPTSVSISGGFGSACDPGGSGANFRIGEEQMLYAARQSCGGAVGTCAHDFTEAFLLRFGGCPYDNVNFSVGYNCEALFPGPSFIVEVPSPYGLLRAEGLDGPGEMGCEQRIATFRLDAQPLTPGEGPCKVTIEQRGPSLLAGRIEATLSLGGTLRDVVIDFENNETETRPLLAVFFQDELCVTQTLSTTVMTEGADVFDVITSGTLNCQANPQRTIAPFTVAVPRPRDGSQATVRFGQDTHTYHTVGSTFPLDLSPTRLRLAAYDLTLCQDALYQTCRDPMPVFYLQGALTP
ncbi:MAG TPA: hypothetical protein PK095_20420 [Myxococcota bacterium]|nr:hypothetical protein [Myxococcota bacterium]